MRGGSVSDAQTTTGPDGLTSVRRTLGPSAGIQHTLASAPGLAGSPVDFTHTAVAGAATVLELVSGDGQSGAGRHRTARAAGGARARRRRQSGTGARGGLDPGAGRRHARADDEHHRCGRPSLHPVDPRPRAGRNSATAVVSGVGTVGFTATGNPGTPPGAHARVSATRRCRAGGGPELGPVVQLREPDGSIRRDRAST